MKKQLLLLMMMLLPMVASADTVEIDGIYYNLVPKAKVATVTSNPNLYTGAIIIPEYVTYESVSYSVASIEESAFEGCSGLISITIPNNVTQIGRNAFMDCTGLASVHISNISSWCRIKFSNPDDEISYLSNPLYYAHHLILNNQEVIDLVIPDGVTSVNDVAFMGCSSLVSVKIPNGVTSIGRNAFEGCSNLTAIVIPNSVTSIADGVFGECSSLTTINLPNNISRIGVFAFNKCESLTSIIIPNSVTSIGWSAFYGCSALSSVYISSKLTNIASYAFDRCTNLNSVHISDIAAWCKITFDNDTSNPLIYAHHLFLNGEEIKDLVIPNGVTTISCNAFLGCNGLTSVTIPNSVTSINYKAFYDCNNIASITIGNSLDVIYGRAFGNCLELSNVYCYSKNVPQIISYALVGEAYYGDVFEGSYIEHATLHVPKASLDSFKDAEPWKNFKDIVKIDMPKYKLNYLVDGIVYKTFEIEEGETITPESAPTKEGYTFSGWSEIPETMPAHDVTVTGTFSINKYKLTYMVDGVEYKCYEVEYGTTITAEAAPTKEGYTFSGWSEIPETMPAHDVTVTGTFTINKYKLTYMVDGDEYKSYEVEYSATITAEAEPTKGGYTFSGWSEIPETMPAHDVTVTGTFSINKYKLTYMVDGEEYKSYEVEYGATITAEAEPTKEGYTFSGWSEIPETMPAHDVTVTGTFTVNKYKLTYMVDGEEYKSYEVEYGASITAEVEPTKEGYTFSGWSEIPETMPAHDVTVTGSFSINKYKLTYVVDGEEYKSYEVDYGATITAEAEPSKEGYTFSGWSEIPETMPAHDVTVTGTFTLDTGIEQIMSNEYGNAMIFTIDGKRVDKLHKGLNIIRMKDGTTRKIVNK